MEKMTNAEWMDRVIAKNRQEVKMHAEQDRAEQEERRSGMPGSIRRNGKWTRERKDGPMAFQAKADWMVREG